MFNQLIVRPIFNLLLAFYSLVGDFGVAIVLFTILIKIILTPLAKAQYLQIKKMQRLQPEIAKIKKKTAGNKQAEMLLTSALHKSNGVKASVSFLSLLIQLPIMIAVYQVIRLIVSSPDAFATYGYGFVKNFEPIKTVISGQAVFHPVLFGIDLTQAPLQVTGITSIFLLGFLAGQVILQRKIMDLRTPMPTDDQGNKRGFRDVMREAQAGKEHSQSELNQITMGKMNKIMPFMTVPIFGFLYGAVSFYYFIANLIDYAQIRYFDREELGEVKTIEHQEVNERLKKAQTAQIMNEQRMQELKNRSRKSKSSEVNITRIKAKKK